MSRVHEPVASSHDPLADDDRDTEPHGCGALGWLTAGAEQRRTASGRRVFGEGFERVLAAARRGDDAAWTALYLDVAPRLRGFLIGRGARDPDDVVSDTLLQVARGLHRFDGGEASFRSWVFAIARNRLIDEVRRSDARPTYTTDTATLVGLAPAVGFEEVEFAHLGVVELEHLLCATTLEQREVLLLRYVADLTLREVAEALGKRDDTVEALHRRGLDALRVRLAASGASSTDAAGER